MRDSQLALQSLDSEQRYPSDPILYDPTLPDNPDIEVQKTRRVSQRCDHLPLHRDTVLIDFIIEALAEGNRVFPPKAAALELRSARLNHNSMRSKK